jgi:hypothetical protein
MKHFMPTPNVIEAAVQVSDVSDLTAQDLIATCIDRLGKFKALDHIHFLQELPKAPLKIKRLKLLDLKGTDTQRHWYARKQPCNHPSTQPNADHHDPRPFPRIHRQNR